jgi:HK97 family phage major capsid protein
MSELENIEKTIKTISDRIEHDFATKSDVKALNDAIASMSRYNALKAEKSPFFGDKALAEEFVQYLCKQVNTGVNKGISRGEDFQKTALNAEGTANQGGNLIPTAVASYVSQLMQVGGIGRQEHDVITLNGPLSINTSTATTAVAFTDDSTELPEGENTFTPVTLTPKQLGAMYVSSEKLLMQSAAPIAELVVKNLVNNALVFEDTKILNGNNESGDGGITGYKSHASVPSDTVASLSALTYEDLIDLTTAVHESIVDGKFYMNRAVLAKVRKMEDDYGRPLVDIQGGTMTLFGAPIKVWNRMDDASAAGELVALYGEPRKAGKIGVSRDMSIAVSDQQYFTKVQLVWRLVYDFGFVLDQPTAVSRLLVGGS